MSRPMTTTAKLRAIVKAAKDRGSRDTMPDRIARKAYNMGREDGRAWVSTYTPLPAQNDSTVYRAALPGLGRMHRDAPPPCITGSQMYDLADAWSSLSNERRGEAILVCLAQQSEAEDPGAPPAWMAEFERKDGVF